MFFRCICKKLKAQQPDAERVNEIGAHFSSQKVTKDRERYEVIRYCRYGYKVIPAQLLGLVGQFTKLIA